MHYLVIDTRFPSPVHVFLEADPRPEEGFPDLPVRQIRLDRPNALTGSGAALAIGRHAADKGHYREFASDAAVSAARYELVEPRYIGPTWKAYARMFRFGGK